MAAAQQLQKTAKAQRKFSDCLPLIKKVLKTYYTDATDSVVAKYEKLSRKESHDGDDLVGYFQNRANLDHFTSTYTVDDVELLDQIESICKIFGCKFKKSKSTELIHRLFTLFIGDARESYEFYGDYEGSFFALKARKGKKTIEDIARDVLKQHVKV